MAHRFAFMDGLRGIGAVQVMFCHLLLVVGFVRPFGLELIVMDGSLAVFIFFFVSGYVLTASYEQSTGTVAELVLARMVRLFVPAIAASLFAIAVWSLLQLLWPQPVAGMPAEGMDASKLGLVLADSFLITPMLGQKSSSFFVGLPYVGDIIRNSTPASFVLWTINIEFLGSMIVLWLCRAGRIGKCLAIPAGVIFLRSLLLPFVLGFLLRQVPLPKIRFSLVAFLVLFAVGTWLSILASNQDYVRFAEKIAQIKYIVPAQSTFSVQKCAAAFLIFVGVLLCWNVRAVLSTSPLQWLGRTSFPLYLTHAALVPVFAAVLSATGSIAAAAVAFATLLAPSVWLFSNIDAVAVRWSRSGRALPIPRDLPDNGAVAVTEPIPVP